MKQRDPNTPRNTRARSRPRSEWRARVHAPAATRSSSRCTRGGARSAPSQRRAASRIAPSVALFAPARCSSCSRYWKVKIRDRARRRDHVPPGADHRRHARVRLRRAAGGGAVLVPRRAPGARQERCRARRARPISSRACCRRPITPRRCSSSSSPRSGSARRTRPARSSPSARSTCASGW